MLCAALAGPAQAATVDVRPPARAGDGDEVTVIAAPGERNDLFLTHPDGTTIDVTDSGAPLSPGAHCASLSANSVRCSARPHPSLRQLFAARVSTGDGNDRIVVRQEASGLSVVLRANAGPGDDTILSANELDDLNGGGGSDVIRGGDGGDVIADGDTRGAVGPDVLDGGPGSPFNTVTYAGRTAPVFVDLRRPGGQGERGENDTVAGMLYAVGGGGNDSLRGNDGENLLTGGPGRDRLSGLGGRDLLRGGPGRDEHLCGRGPDSLEGVERFDLVEGDCEGIAGFSGLAGNVSYMPYPIRANRRRLVFRLGCPDNDGEPLPCGVRFAVREAGGRRRLIAAVRTRKRGGRGKSDLRVPTTKLGERLLARRGRTLAEVSLRGPAYSRTAWTIRLGRR
jgi:hypothetical protein